MQVSASTAWGRSSGGAAGELSESRRNISSTGSGFFRLLILTQKRKKSYKQVEIYFLTMYIPPILSAGEIHIFKLYDTSNCKKNRILFDFNHNQSRIELVFSRI